jgi:hypothetical protein
VTSAIAQAVLDQVAALWERTPGEPVAAAHRDDIKLVC